MFLGARVCKWYKLIYITAWDICCNTLKLIQHKLATPAACAFPSHRFVRCVIQSVRVRSCHTTVTVSLQVTCNTGDNAMLQENHITCKRERIKTLNSRF